MNEKRSPPLRSEGLNRGEEAGTRACGFLVYHGSLRGLKPQRPNKALLYSPENVHETWACRWKMGSELQAMTLLRTGHQPALEFSMAAINLNSEEVGVIGTPPTAAGAQTHSTPHGMEREHFSHGLGVANWEMR